MSDPGAPDGPALHRMELVQAGLVAFVPERGAVAREPSRSYRIVSVSEAVMEFPGLTPEEERRRRRRALWWARRDTRIAGRTRRRA